MNADANNNNQTDGSRSRARRALPAGPRPTRVQAKILARQPSANCPLPSSAALRQLLPRKPSRRTDHADRASCTKSPAPAGGARLAPAHRASAIVPADAGGAGYLLERAGAGAVPIHVWCHHPALVRWRAGGESCNEARRVPRAAGRGAGDSARHRAAYVEAAWIRLVVAPLVSSEVTQLPKKMPDRRPRFDSGPVACEYWISQTAGHHRLDSIMLALS